MTYSIQYDRETVCGEPGYSYRVFASSDLIAEGWSRGSRRDAEVTAKASIRAYEELLGLAAKAHPEAFS